MEYKVLKDQLVEAVIEQGASDLHITVGHPPMVRVASTLIPLVKYPSLKPHDTEGILFELLTPENKELFLKTKDLDFAYMNEAGVRFRADAASAVWVSAFRNGCNALGSERTPCS